MITRSNEVNISTENHQRTYYSFLPAERLHTITQRFDALTPKPSGPYVQDLPSNSEIYCAFLLVYNNMKYVVRRLLTLHGRKAQLEFLLTIS